MKRVFIIFNRYANGGRAQKIESELHAILRQAKIDAHLVIPDHFKEIENISNEANRKGYERIIAIGGDGTINRTIQGFYNQNGQRISDTVFGSVHIGGSPDFHKSYHLPLHWKKALKTAIYAPAVPIAIGMAMTKERTQYFACCLNIGFGPQLAQKANSGIRKYLGDKLGTFISILQVLTCFKPVSLKVNGIKKNIQTTNLWNLSIGLTPFIASGIKAPVRKPLLDSFYLIPIEKRGIFKLTHLFKTLYGYSDIQTRQKILNLQYATEAFIQSKSCRPVGFELDGDPYGILPVKIRMAEKLDIAGVI